MKARSELGRSVGEFAFERTICYDYAAVDGGGCRPGGLAGLETDIFEQGRFGKCLFGDGIGLVNTDPPAEEVQQVMCVAAESRLGQTPNTLPVEKTIYPDRICLLYTSLIAAFL